MTRLVILALACLLGACATSGSVQSNHTSQDPCGVLASIQAGAAPSTSKEIANKWGPFASLVGPAWVRLPEREGENTVIHRFRWIEGGRALRRVTTYPVLEKHSGDVTTFVLTSEPGIWNSCTTVAAIGAHRTATYRMVRADTIGSDWWSWRNVVGREEIKLTPSGEFENRIASSASGDKLPYGPAFLYVPYSEEELTGFSAVFGEERAAFHAEIERKRREDAAQRRAAGEAFWSNLALGLQVATQATAQAYAERQSSVPGPSYPLPRSALPARPGGQRAPSATPVHGAITSVSASAGTAGAKSDGPAARPAAVAQAAEQQSECRRVPQKLGVMKASRISEEDARREVESDPYPSCVSGPTRRLDTIDCRTEKALPRIDANGHQIKEPPSYLYRCFATWVCEKGKLDCGPARPASASRQ